MSIPIPYITTEEILSNPILIGNIKVYLIWFDSYGAKSSSILIETPENKILVDPGVAAMQPGYPLDNEKKLFLHNYALDFIKQVSANADTIIITHYHFDHFTNPAIAKKLYLNKNIMIKNPNLYINKSQWKRAREFYRELSSIIDEKIKGEGKNIGEEEDIINHKGLVLPNPMEDLPLAQSKDFGSYNSRRKELLMKGERWFRKLEKELWNSGKMLKEFKTCNTSLTFIDNSEFQIGKATLRFTKPLFHGIEFDKIGWTVGFSLKYGGKGIVYTSDIQGPFIEDYAAWIIKEKPDLLIADGPPTYLFGYMINRINMKRAEENLARIVESFKGSLIIYDHHLTREPKYIDKIPLPYSIATERGIKLIAASQWFGKRPLINFLKNE